MNPANSSMYCRRNCSVDASVTRPSSVIRPRSNCTYASTEFISGELQKARMLRKCCWAMAVPILPGDVPMMAELARKGVLAVGPARPVDGILQTARDRPVVLGRDEQDGVDRGNRILERGGH